jgi:hypothetical protein
VSVYVLAMACLVHGSCHDGWFLVKNPALIDCERDVMPMIEGHRSKDRAGNVLVWHARGCVTGNNPPQGEMLGMF